MDLLFHSPWQTALAASLASFFFFVIQWTLNSTKVRGIQERIFLAQKEFSRETLDELVDGLIMRIVGFVHNTLQVILALRVVFDEHMWEDSFYSQSATSQFIVAVTAGFFFWDFIICAMRPHKDGMAFVLHGLLCFIVYGYIALSGHMHVYGCAFLLWEISTPFTQFRWILYKMGMEDSTVFLVNGLIMMFFFFVCRICWGTYLSTHYFVKSWEYLAHGDGSIPIAVVWMLRLFNLVLNGLNYWWFNKMVRIARSMLSKKQE